VHFREWDEQSASLHSGCASKHYMHYGRWPELIVINSIQSPFTGMPSHPYPDVPNRSGTSPPFSCINQSTIPGMVEECNITLPGSRHPRRIVSRLKKRHARCQFPSLPKRLPTLSISPNPSKCILCCKLPKGTTPFSVPACLVVQSPGSCASSCRIFPITCSSSARENGSKSPVHMVFSGYLR
jgi:hypothetical protein